MAYERTQSRTALKSIFSFLLLALVCVILVLPIVWMFVCSLMTAEELYSRNVSLIPRAPTLGNYLAAFRDYAAGRWLLNSTIVTVGITLAQVLTSILAGYSFARFEFALKKLLFVMVLGTMVVPFAVTMIPNYILISSLRGKNTHWAVIVPYAASGFGIFLMRQHMLSIPRDLLDAAKMDGASSRSELWSIAVPITKSAIGALTILLGLNAWNIYFWPMLILSKVHTQTLPIGLSNFADPEFGIVWGVLMATASVASLFAIALYVVGQRQIQGSVAVSGLKG